MELSPAPKLVVWTQPRDPLADDLISVDHCLVDADEEDRRRAVVTWVTSISDTARPEAGEGSFVARKGNKVLIEFPVGSPEPDFIPRMTVALLDPAGSRSEWQDVSDEVRRVAALAGHQAPEDLVRARLLPLLDQPWPATIRRAWLWMLHSLQIFLNWSRGR